MEGLLCQADARSAGDESSLAHRGTSGRATGVRSLLNSVRKYTDSTAVGLGIVLVHTRGLVAALKGEINQYKLLCATLYMCACGVHLSANTGILPRSSGSSGL